MTEYQRPMLVGGERLASEVDRVFGGGDKYHPVELEQARASLSPMVDVVRSQVAEIPSSLRGDRVIVEATLWPNYIANSYFPRGLFTYLDLRPLGSRNAVETYRRPKSVEENAPTKTIILSASVDSLAELAHLIATPLPSVKRTRKAQEELLKVSNVHLPEVGEVVVSRPDGSTSEPRLFEAVMNPNPDSAWERQPISQLLLDKWESFVSGPLRGEVLTSRIREVGGLTFVPIRIPEEVLEEVVRFNPLRAIRPMPELRPLPVVTVRAAGTNLAPGAVDPALLGEPVAVFDGGCNPTDKLFDGVVELVELTTQGPDAGLVLHGNAVTAAILWGDAQSVGAWPVQPPAPVHHYRVLPTDDPADVDIYEVLDHIVAVVRQKKYKVVNLSLGPNISVDDHEPVRWTAELDQLAYDLDTLFVVACGNNGEDDSTTGLDRVQVPGDMVNGLSVGASNAAANDTPWDRAPYSAVGPGRLGLRTQPIVMAFGGDTAAGAPFRTIQPDGSIWTSNGTSFAAPVVANGVACLSNELGELSNSNVLRALAVHFASTKDAATKDDPGLGYGRVNELALDLDCADNEVTVLYRGTIARDQMLALLLPVPDGIDEGNLTFRWTAVINSPTDPTEVAEYTTRGLELTFRPNATKFALSNVPGKKGQVKLDLSVPADQEMWGQLVQLGATPGTHPVSKTPTGRHGSEAARREEGKWETIRQWSVGVAAKGVRRPRIDVSFLARGEGVLDLTADPLDFALVASVRAKSGVKLYEMASKEFDVLTKLGSDIDTGPIQT